MPVFSDLSSLSLYYGGSSSYNYLSGSYANHSSIIASNLNRPSPSYGTSSGRTLSRPIHRGYTPLLATISETQSSPRLGRINSPKLYHPSPKYKIQKPISINTADIDVSANRYLRKLERATPGSPNSSVYSSSPPCVSLDKPEKDDSVFMPRIDQNHRNTIKRGRTVVRLHTQRKASNKSKEKPKEEVVEAKEKSPENDAEKMNKDIGINRPNWRQNFEPTELKSEKRSKTKPLSERLVEKFLIKDRQIEEDAIKILEEKRKLREENLNNFNRRSTKRKSVKKTPSFHEICKDISSDKINEDLNPCKEPTRKKSNYDIMKAIRRNSAEIGQEEIKHLDGLLLSEGATTPPEKDPSPPREEPAQTEEPPKKCKKYTRNKTTECTETGDSVCTLQRRKILKKRTVSSDLDKSIEAITPRDDKEIAKHTEQVKADKKIHMRRLSDHLDNLEKEIENLPSRILRNSGNQQKPPGLPMSSVHKETTIPEDVAQKDKETTPEKKPIPKISGTVEIENRPNLKVIVDDIKVESVQTPVGSPTGKKFKFNVTVDVAETPVKVTTSSTKMDESIKEIPKVQKTDKVIPKPPEVEKIPQVPTLKDTENLSKDASGFVKTTQVKQQDKKKPDDSDKVIKMEPPTQVKPAKVSSVPLKKTAEEKRKAIYKQDNFDELTDGDFWAKIGKRETVYYKDRKKKLEEDTRKQREQFWNCWIEDEVKQDNPNKSETVSKLDAADRTVSTTIGFDVTKKLDVVPDKPEKKTQKTPDSADVELKEINTKGDTTEAPISPEGENKLDTKVIETKIVSTKLRPENLVLIKDEGEPTLIKLDNSTTKTVDALEENLKKETKKTPDSADVKPKGDLKEINTKVEPTEAPISPKGETKLDKKVVETKTVTTKSIPENLVLVKDEGEPTLIKLDAEQGSTQKVETLEENSKKTKIPLESADVKTKGVSEEIMTKGDTTEAPISPKGENKFDKKVVETKIVSTKPRPENLVLVKDEGEPTSIKLDNIATTTEKDSTKTVAALEENLKKETKKTLDSADLKIKEVSEETNTKGNTTEAPISPKGANKLDKTVVEAKTISGKSRPENLVLVKDEEELTSIKVDNFTTIKDKDSTKENMKKETMKSISPTISPKPDDIKQSTPQEIKPVKPPSKSESVQVQNSTPKLEEIKTNTQVPQTSKTTTEIQKPPMLETAEVKSKTEEIKSISSKTEVTVPTLVPKITKTPEKTELPTVKPRTDNIEVDKIKLQSPTSNSQPDDLKIHTPETPITTTTPKVEPNEIKGSKPTTPTSKTPPESPKTKGPLSKPPKIETSAARKDSQEGESKIKHKVVIKKVVKTKKDVEEKANKTPEGSKTTSIENKKKPSKAKKLKPKKEAIVIAKVETKELKAEVTEITNQPHTPGLDFIIKDKFDPVLKPNLDLVVPTESQYKKDCKNDDKDKEPEVKDPFAPPKPTLIVLPGSKPKDDAPVVIMATPRDLRKRVPMHRKPPQPVKVTYVSESDSDDDSSSEENSSDDSGSDEYNTNVVIANGGGHNIRKSTSSNDSGFDSSAPGSPANNRNRHNNGSSTTSGDSREPILAHNPALALDSADISDTGDLELAVAEKSHAYSEFQKSGRVTPPATSIPRFRKYLVEDFVFLKVLGKGSFGKVLLAELKNTEYYYAVKCLKKDIVLEDDDVECTLIERKVLALGTKHPYLCHLFCTFQTESHLFFVMEYLNGGDLMFHIQVSGRFPEARGRFYAAEIVSGLKFLHAKGIVYRDLKLDNILLDFDGHVRIADFGMCKLQIFLDRTADTFCGTPDYMAPEIIRGQHYNQGVDWWSFGVLLYEMLIGQSPFSGGDEDELFWSICNERPVMPRFLTQEAVSILTMLLEKDSSQRLGNKFCPAGDIADQPFFKPICWDKLERRQLEPPFKPKVQHPLDTQYFDKAFTAERVKLTPIEKDILHSMDQTQFHGFSYTNPNATDK